MFGKCFLHRPVHSKTVVNVLPNTVLLKCSKCDTEHSVGQPCPAVWSGHFNLKDLGTALGNRAGTVQQRQRLRISHPHISNTVRCILYNLYIHCSSIISSGFCLSNFYGTTRPFFWILLCSVHCACVGNYWGALPHTMFVLCSCSRFRCQTLVLISRLMSLCQELK